MQNSSALSKLSSLLLFSTLLSIPASAQPQLSLEVTPTGVRVEPPSSRTELLVPLNLNGMITVDALPPAEPEARFYSPLPLESIWNWTVIHTPMDSATTKTSTSAATKAAFLAYGTAAFIDTSITSWCHGANRCSERNPLLRPIVDNHGIVTAMGVKGAMHTGIALWLSSQKANHPKAVLWTAVALAVAQGTVDAYNVKQLRRK